MASSLGTEYFHEQQTAYFNIYFPGCAVQMKKTRRTPKNLRYFAIRLYTVASVTKDLT
jgi:hypothetical protein